MSNLPLPSADTIARQKMLADTVVPPEDKKKQKSDQATSGDSNSGSDQCS